MLCRTSGHCAPAIGRYTAAASPESSVGWYDDSFPKQSPDQNRRISAVETRKGTRIGDAPTMKCLDRVCARLRERHGSIGQAQDDASSGVVEGSDEPMTPLNHRGVGVVGGLE